jgi:hypothetical protein
VRFFFFLFFSLSRSSPLVGQLQVPAKGLELSRPQIGDVPGFTIDLPATTISYNWNFSNELITKLQALLDTFDDLNRVTGTNAVPTAGQ